MKISEEKIQKWESLNERGDKQKIAELLEIAPPHLSKIFRDKEATLTQVYIINVFYKEREKELKKLLK